MTSASLMVALEFNLDPNDTSIFGCVHACAHPYFKTMLMTIKLCHIIALPTVKYIEDFCDPHSLATVFHLCMVLLLRVLT